MNNTRNLIIYLLASSAYVYGMDHWNPSAPPLYSLGSQLYGDSTRGCFDEKVIYDTSNPNYQPISPERQPESVTESITSQVIFDMIEMRDGQSAIKAIDQLPISVTARDGQGCSLLHNAARIGLTEVAKALINKRADVNSVDYSGKTPLYYAIWHGRTDIVQFLISRGASTNFMYDGNNFLHIAMLRPNAQAIIPILLRSNSRLYVRDNNGHLPLCDAIRANNNGLINALVNNLVDINACENDGTTPLDAAIINKNQNAVNLLIAKGANTRSSDIYDLAKNRDIHIDSKPLDYSFDYSFESKTSNPKPGKKASARVSNQDNIKLEYFLLCGICGIAVGYLLYKALEKDKRPGLY